MSFASSVVSPLQGGETEEEVLSRPGAHTSFNRKVFAIAVGLGSALLIGGASSHMHSRLTTSNNKSVVQEVIVTDEKVGKSVVVKKKTHVKHEVRAEEKTCIDIEGVILQQDDNSFEQAWQPCAEKWSADCRGAGCCADWGMKCYEKSDSWSACNSECKDIDENNDTWTCKELWPPAPRTFETCRKTCEDSDDCFQAVFSSDDGAWCRLSKKINTTVVWASDSVSSTICGTSRKKIEELTDAAKSQLPFVLPQQDIQQCSWSGEDCRETRCCNDVSCDKEFTQCFGYSCYNKTEYFAGCRLDAPPEDWDGKWLGGQRERKVIPPAGAQAKVMGTSLYCFIVVSWDAPAAKPFWSTESELVGNIKDNGLSIMQCDGNDFLDGGMSEVAEWGSFSNIDLFQDVWKKVQANGRWKDFDWTVKVDSDAVFFPDRLKQHLDKLRVPQGSRVYIENNDYRFNFMGALEVVSNPAMNIWLEQHWNCIHGKHEGGEDFFMKGCMDGLGVDHMIDHQLLWDKYAAQDVHCTDGWSAAYHFHKSVLRWRWCYNEAVCGDRAKSCDQGLEVEYVMDD